MMQLLDMFVSLVGRARGTKRLLAQGARCCTRTFELTLTSAQQD